MEKAIKLAIEGGYTNVSKFVREEHTAMILLDPLFWQALGKALGWTTTYNGRAMWTNRQWLKEWHCFIDHLAEGKDAESFFKSLTEPK